MWSSEQANPTRLSGGEIECLIKGQDIRPEKFDPTTRQEMLLREMQHRVANSLQIVASILSLKARKVQSNDVRLHLLDAYGRVMSVAAVQRQLLNSSQASVVRIDDYLSELGRRLATSLAEGVSLSVVADAPATMASNKAVAIGLIVTELVINALRHAFPEDRQGTIVVAYKTVGSGWRISVSDDGVGLSNTAMSDPRSGHGTEIIRALAQELDARVVVKSDSEGTRVSVIHPGVCASSLSESGWVRA